MFYGSAVSCHPTIKASMYEIFKLIRKNMRKKKKRDTNNKGYYENSFKEHDFQVIDGVGEFLWGTERGDLDFLKDENSYKSFQLNAKL